MRRTSWNMAEKKNTVASTVTRVDRGRGAKKKRSKSHYTIDFQTQKMRFLFLFFPEYGAKIEMGRMMGDGMGMGEEKRMCISSQS